MTANSPYHIKNTLVGSYVPLAFFLLLISLLYSSAGYSNPLKFIDTSSNIRLPEDTSNLHRVPEENTFMYAKFSDSTKSEFTDDDNFDEIILSLNVPRVGSIDIPAIISNKVAYLPIREIFDYMKLKNTLSSDMDSVTGFFINPKNPYLIDKQHNLITYDGKTYKLKETDLIRTENNLYLRSNYFGDIFGLDCKFDFRSLSILLTTKIDMPVMREMQQEQMRKNIGQLKGEKKADTTIHRSFSFFHLGVADWGIASSQDSKGINNTRLNLDLGAHVAGGEAQANLSYNNGMPFDVKQQYYRWRYVNNDNTLLRQVTAGRMYTQSTSSLFAPINGVQISNTPTTFRRSFGTYRLNGNTDAGWTVELYVNDVLVNYMKSDASGFYTFEVPLVYGSSVVKLKFYSPWGEERTREENINVPFNFLPVNDLEYSLTAGIVDDGSNSKFSRLNMNYGLGNHITVGAGAEYLSSLASGNLMPYQNVSIRLGSNFLISGEHTQGVRTKGLISYRLPSNLQAELSYVKYTDGQTAIKYNYESEKRAVISMPFKGKKFTAFTRVTIDQVMLPKQSKFTSGEWLISAIVSNISTNLTTYAILTDAVQPLVYSNLSFSFRVPFGLRLTPQLQYEYRQKSLSMYKCDMEKNLFNHGFLNASFQKDILNHTYTASVGLRYNFAYAQTSLTTMRTSYATAIVASARGSIIYDDKMKKVYTNAENNVGKGSVVVMPFLDYNCNGVRDADEPLLKGLNLRVNGGKIVRNRKDSMIQIIGLEGYTSYIIELDKGSFDNVAWQVRNATIRITIEPNQSTLIQVPVAVVGEVAGNVILKNAKGSDGLGRMIVNIYDSKSKLVTRLLTEMDGYFSYMGLAPGSYSASLDKDQLKKLKMTASANVPFVIKMNKEGDVVDGLEFAVQQQ